MTSDDSAFELLVSSFLSLVGQDSAQSSGVTGFEFDTEAYSVAVWPVGDDQVMVQVAVAALQPGELADPAVLLMLHRLNEDARTEHGWTATIDAQDQLLLYTLRPLRQTDAQALKDAVAQGLDRAEALSAMVAHVAPPQTEDDGTPPDVQALRV